MRDRLTLLKRRELSGTRGQLPHGWRKQLDVLGHRCCPLRLFLSIRGGPRSSGDASLKRGGKRKRSAIGEAPNNRLRLASKGYSLSRVKLAGSLQADSGRKLLFHRSQ